MGNQGLKGKNGKMDFVWPQNRPYSAKKHSISNDYEITQRSLGVGINGKVLECVRKTDRQRFALKVGIATDPKLGFRWLGPMG